MTLYVRTMQLLAHALAECTLLAGAAVVLPVRALLRRLEPAPTDWLRIRTDHPLTTDEIAFVQQLPPAVQRPVAQRVTGRPGWPPALPITRTTFGASSCTCDSGDHAVGLDGTRVHLIGEGAR